MLPAGPSRTGPAVLHPDSCSLDLAARLLFLRLERPEGSRSRGTQQFAFIRLENRRTVKRLRRNVMTHLISPARSAPVPCPSNQASLAPCCCLRRSRVLGSGFSHRPRSTAS